MSNITNFNFLPTEGTKTPHLVRTLTIDGNPWFVAKDVCDVLGYSEPRRAVAQHCKGGAKRTILTEGGPQEMTIIPERDLYRLVMRSKLPSAERFEEWVVGTVLPAVRKTGSYVRGEEVLDPTAPDYLDRLKDLLIEAQERKLAAAESKVAYLQPKADAFEVIQEATGSLTVTDAAKVLGAKRKDLFAFLEIKNWITKGPNRQAKAYGLKHGYMDTRTHPDDGGRIRVTPVVTTKGLAYLADVKAKRKAA